MTSVERLASVSSNALTGNTLSVGFSYDAGGRRTSLTLPFNTTVSYGYDQDSNITSIVYTISGISHNLIYTYDADERRLTMAGNLANTVPPSTMSATYGAANQLLTWNGVSATNDNNNNLTANPANNHTYSWDLRNQLASDSNGTSYYYDPFGRRVCVAVSGQNTSSQYDGIFPSAIGNTPLLASPGAAEEYAYNNASGVTTVPLHDVLGSTVGIVQSASSTLPWFYSPYGAPSSSSVSDTSGGFTGREWDANTGLLMFPARYYSPALQRLLSEDPIGFGGGSINLFEYAGSEPADFTDPLGLEVYPAPPPGLTIVSRVPGSLGGPGGAAYVSTSSEDYEYDGGIGEGVAEITGSSVGHITLAALMKLPAGADPEGLDSLVNPIEIGPAVGMALGKDAERKLLGREAHNAEERLIKRLEKALKLKPEQLERFHDELHRLTKEEGKKGYNES